MSVNELKAAIQHLKPEDFIELVNWPAEYDHISMGPANRR